MLFIKAAVLGAARAVGALAPGDVEAHFVVAACEVRSNCRSYRFNLIQLFHITDAI